MSEVKEGALENLQGRFKNIDNKDTVRGITVASGYERELTEKEKNQNEQDKNAEMNNEIDPNNLVSQLKQDREDDLVR